MAALLEAHEGRAKHDKGGLVQEGIGWMHLVCAEAYCTEARQPIHRPVSPHQTLQNSVTF